MTTFTFQQGKLPILLSIPHNGTDIPEDIKSTMTPAALERKDTDWHLNKLFDFASAMGISIICPIYSRYVIDLNRAIDGSNLYPGKNSTELCPLTTFDFMDIYKPAQKPDHKNIQWRIENYWKPYHKKINDTLKTIKDKFQYAILFEAHSIQSTVPRFFSGQLDDLNIGTNDGKSCGTELEKVVLKSLQQNKNYSVTLNDRFKGGYITRIYGQPDANIHAIQLEISQYNYMNEKAPYDYQEDKASQLKQCLIPLFKAIINWTEEQNHEYGIRR